MMNKMILELPEVSQKEVLSMLEQIKNNPAVLGKTIRDTRQQLFDQHDMSPESRKKAMAFLITAESIQRGESGSLEDNPIKGVTSLDEVMSQKQNVALDPESVWKAERESLVKAASDSEAAGNKEAALRIREIIVSKDTAMAEQSANPEYQAAIDKLNSDHTAAMSKINSDSEALKKRAEDVAAGVFFDENNQPINEDEFMNKHLAQHGKVAQTPGT